MPKRALIDVVLSSIEYNQSSWNEGGNAYFMQICISLKLNFTDNIKVGHFEHYSEWNF